MNPQPLIYFGNDQPRDRGPARVRSKRNMIVRPLDGTPRPVAIGEEIEISNASLRQLEPADIEFIGRVPESVSFDI